MNNVLCQALAHWSCKPLTLTRYLIAFAILLHLPCSYETASFASHLSKTCPKYFNSNICSNHMPFILPHIPICFSIQPHHLSLFLHSSIKYPTITFRFSFNLPHKTNSSIYKRLDNLYPLLSSLSPFSPPSSMHT